MKYKMPEISLLCLCSFLLSTTAIGQPLENPVDERYISMRIDGAVNPELVPDAAAIQLFTAMIVDLNSKGRNVELDYLMEEMDLTKDDFGRLKAVSQSVVEESEKARSTGLASLCNDQTFSALTRSKGSAHDIAMRLDDLDGEINNLREDAFKVGIHSQIGAYPSQRVMGWLEDNIKPAIKIVEFDTVKRAVELGTDPGATFNRNCMKSNEDNATPDSGEISNSIEENY